MHRLRMHASLALAVLLVAVPRAMHAQETASDTLLTVNHYLDWETVSDPQISPDGSRIVFTRRWVNPLADRWESALWIMHADGTHQHFLAKGSNARWSPDGTRILYIAEGEPKGAQIFVRWMDDAGATSQVTRVTERITSPAWSPDGNSIVFGMFVPDPTKWHIDLPPAPKGAHWTPAPRIVDRMHFRQDRVGFTDPGFMHLFLVPATGGTARQLTHGDWNVGARFDDLARGMGLAWTPDGKAIVFDGLRGRTGDHAYQESGLYVLDVASGAIRDLVTKPGFWAGPQIAPDGRSVAFAGYDSSDATHTTSDLWVVGLDGSGMRDLSRSLDRDPRDLHWAPNGRGIYFSANTEGTSNTYLVGLDGKIRQVTTGSHMLSLGSLAKTLTAVGTESDPAHPPDIVRYDLRHPETVTRLTAVNADVLHGIHLGAVQQVWYRSSGGARVEGWIVKPPAFDPAKKYPLILHIHGGPFASYNVGFNFAFQNFAADGFVVLYVNPRGSTGYGSAFSSAIDHNYPSVDYEDLMAGVDTVVGRGYIDTTRMYVTGCSGGGVLSSWVVGHTHRFAAAAVRCPVIDWLSMVGETDIPLFTYSFFHKPFWVDPSEWLSHSSLMYVGNVTTPTLLMTGVLDRRTPIPQSEEFFEALKERHVPTVLLRFNGEFHGTGSKPSNFMRTQLYIMSWFDRYPGKGGSGR